MSTQAFGVIGMEVMGRNIALNIERNGFPVAIYNRTTSKSEELIKENPGKNIKMGKDLKEFVALLQKPRRILIMVKAGKPVDYVLKDLVPLLEEGDIVIDGGNSLYQDTERRAAEIQGTGVRFFGMGISGGEEGALWGPSLMPGGDEEAYNHLEPILKKIAAKAPGDGHPCVTYLGRGGSGHFVKMVHNGIEYGDMQLIAEAYDILKRLGGLNNAQLKEVFEEWNQGEDLQSFLIEITAKVMNYSDETTNGQPLVELILDKAGQKGTGKWTVQAAMDLGVAVPTITAAVDARILSSLKDQRIEAAKQLTGPTPTKLTDIDIKQLIADVRAALYCSKVCSYAQGFTLLQAADKEFDFGLRIGEVASIWEAGCIIRAAFLKDITEAIKEDPHLPNLLLTRRFKEAVNQRQEAWRRVVQFSQYGIPLPAFSASLAYFDAYRSERLPANLIQAQRDYFGAHTYERVDKEGTFHTEWSAQQK